MTGEITYNVGLSYFSRCSRTQDRLPGHYVIVENVWSYWSVVPRHTWATLCTTSIDGTPYAIEFTHFLMDGEVYGLINPKGRTAENIAANPNVCLKVCRTDDLCRRFQAVSCFGRGEYVQDRKTVGRAWDALEQRLHLKPGAYAKFKAKFADPSTDSPLFRLKIECMTGVASHRDGKREDNMEEEQ